LVAAGGNLGLFLGLSCLSILFSCVDGLKKILAIAAKNTGSR
jgi:hypothetical protein